MYYVLCTISPVSAVTDFSTSFDSTYIFDQSGNAQVTHLIEIKNNLAHLYTTVYSLAIRSSELTNITTSVNEKNVTPQIETTNNLTNIHITAPDPKIGKEQINLFKISYATPSFAEKIGNTYALTLPRAQKGNEAESFVRRIEVPESYPPLSHSTIPPQSTIEENGMRSYVFVGAGNVNITLLFGDQVTYQLSLGYDLKNPTGKTGPTEIALPPDTPYQQVILDSIDPAPNEIVLDQDGNWLARYELGYLEKKHVTARLYVTISPSPINYDPSTSLPVKTDKYWERNDQISSLAHQLKTPKNIYQYLLDNFSYDYSKIYANQRLGVEEALKNPSSAICNEFTDTFIALSRTLNIPARSIIGYAYSNNDSLRPLGQSTDVLHSYPEYYDPEHKLWVSIDPTWGHTTGGVNYYDRLDFSHIAFVRLGLESEYPLPPGSYRDDLSVKQVEVSVASDAPTTSPQISEVNGFLVNTGNAAIINQDGITYLPPYGKTLSIQQFPSTSSPKKVVGYILLIICAILFLKFLRPWRRFMRPNT